MVAVLDLAVLAVTLILDLADLAMEIPVLAVTLTPDLADLVMEIPVRREGLEDQILAVLAALVQVCQEGVSVDLVVLIDLVDLVVQIDLVVLDGLNLVVLEIESEARTTHLVVHMEVVSVLLGITQIGILTIEERLFNVKLVSSIFISGLVFTSCKVNLQFLSWQFSRMEKVIWNKNNTFYFGRHFSSIFR